MNTSSFFVLLFFSGSVCVCVCEPINMAEKAVSRDKFWETIDSYLEEHEPTRDDEINMFKALEWLDTFKHSWLPYRLRFIRICKRLELLEDLLDKISVGQCDIDSYKLRRSLIEVTTSKANNSRVELIIVNYAERLAAACSNVLPNSFESKLTTSTKQNKVAKDALERIRPFFMQLIRAEVNGEMQDYIKNHEQQSAKAMMTYDEYLKWAGDPVIEGKIYEKFILCQPQMISKSTAAIAIDVMTRFMAENPTSELLICHECRNRGDRLATLFSRLVLDSCRIVERAYGPTVFDLAQEDIVYLRHKGFRQGQVYVNYYLSWAIYRGCTGLVGHRTSSMEIGHKIRTVYFSRGSSRPFDYDSDPESDENSNSDSDTEYEIEIEDE